MSKTTIEISKEFKNKINYLVPIFVDKIKSDENNFKIIIKCYCYLKYILLNKHQINNYKKNFNNISDKIINGIFKYLCYEKKMTISHKYHQMSK